MPDTTITALPIAQSFDGAALRQPALFGFLARRILRMLTPPIAGTREHLVETCRAEIDWAVIDWKRLNPRWNGYAHEAELEAERCRLPHEHAAARVVNAHSHMDTFEYLMRMALRHRDRETFDGYRPQLRKALVAYRQAGRDYRRLRAELDAPTGAPCMQREAA